MSSRVVRHLYSLQVSPHLAPSIYFGIPDYSTLYCIPRTVLLFHPLPRALSPLATSRSFWVSTSPFLFCINNILKLTTSGYIYIYIPTRQTSVVLKPCPPGIGKPSMVFEEETGLVSETFLTKQLPGVPCLTSLTCCSHGLHGPSFLASSQRFFFNFLSAKHSALKFISPVRSGLFPLSRQKLLSSLLLAEPPERLRTAKEICFLLPEAVRGRGRCCARNERRAPGPDWVLA